MRILLLALFLNTAIAETIITAHKGVWKDHIYPQNTFAALEEAVNRGYLAVEFDVKLTKDKQLVLAHDDALKKVSDCTGNISEKTLFELENCTVDKNTLLPITQILVKKVRFPQPMISLSMMMDYLLSQSQLKLIWIDLKDKKMEAVEAMVEVLANKNLTEEEWKKIVVNSGEVKLLRALKEKLPPIQRSIEGKWGGEPLTQLEYYFAEVRDSYEFLSLTWVFA
jgi:glycerophosphoryl diester phosphodiesterase